MALEDVKNGLADIAELEVVTFTGTLAGAMKQEDGKSVLDWEGLLDKANASAEVSIVAATKLKIDGDTLLFISKDAEASFLDVHREAVEAAQNYRRGVLELFGEFFGVR